VELYLSPKLKAELCFYYLTNSIHEGKQEGKKIKQCDILNKGWKNCKTQKICALRLFDQTVESKTKRWEDNKFVQSNDLYRSPLKNHTLTKLILTPQSLIENMHLNGSFGTFRFRRSLGRNMAGKGTLLKWKSSRMINSASGFPSQ